MEREKQREIERQQKIKEREEILRQRIQEEEEALAEAGQPMIPKKSKFVSPVLFCYVMFSVFLSNIIYQSRKSFLLVIHFNLLLFLTGK